MSRYTNLSIDDILTVFREFDGIYQKEMVDAAIERREEIIPRLIAVLRQVIADPDEYSKDQDLYDHIYALMLLGHFGAAEAHDTIIELFSLPDGIPQELFGEITTDNLPFILLNTCGGSLDKIRAMSVDRGVDMYCRISALQAMAYAVAAGIAARPEVVGFMGTLFSGQEAEEESEFWSFAAGIVQGLYPEENMAVIEEAYEQGLISPLIIDRTAFKEALAAGRQSALERLRTNLEADSLGDLHAVMSGWACFRNDLDLVPASSPVDLFASGTYGEPLPPGARKSDQTKKKQKRKQAKASKRKNRK
jgi:Protein of unknown function (DUF1186)